MGGLEGDGGAVLRGGAARRSGGGGGVGLAQVRWRCRVGRARWGGAVGVGRYGWRQGRCGVWGGRHCAHQRQRGACTCGRVASGGGGGGGALRRAALGVGRRVWGRASGEGLVGVGG